MRFNICGIKPDATRYKKKKNKKNKALTILRERNRRYSSLVSLEVGDISTLLQIPNLDDRIISASAKDETVRVKLGTSKGRNYEKPKFVDLGQHGNLCHSFSVWDRACKQYSRM